MLVARTVSLCSRVSRRSRGSRPYPDIPNRSQLPRVPDSVPGGFDVPDRSQSFSAVFPVVQRSTMKNPEAKMRSPPLLEANATHHKNFDPRRRRKKKGEKEKKRKSERKKKRKRERERERERSKGMKERKWRVRFKGISKTHNKKLNWESRKERKRREKKHFEKRSPSLDLIYYRPSDRKIIYIYFGITSLIQSTNHYPFSSSQRFENFSKSSFTQKT